MNEPLTPDLPIGTPVEVWNRSTRGWSGPFAVVRTTPEGFVIRRPGESEPVPATFAPESVRRRNPG